MTCNKDKRRFAMTLEQIEEAISCLMQLRDMTIKLGDQKGLLEKGKKK